MGSTGYFSTEDAVFSLAEGSLVLKGQKHRVQICSELLHYFTPLSNQFLIPHYLISLCIWVSLYHSGHTPLHPI